jgi:FkbM family methyltransferase
MAQRGVKGLVLQSLAMFGDGLRRTPIARWQWLGRLHANFAVRLGKAESVAVGPFRVFVDPRDRVIAKKLILYGGYEQREIDLLCSLVRPGDCVLDIGANIGLYSLALSRAVGPEGRVIAFEPDPDNATLLRRNLEANRCANVTVLEYALGDASREVRLYESEDNRGALSTSDVLGVGEDHAISVHMRRGDAVLAELGVQARVAKIDVEGAEPLVIAGLGAQLPQVLMFEFVPQLLRAAGRNPAEFLHKLRSAGYSLAAVDPETGRVRDLTPAELAAGAVTEAADRNILARR